MAQSQGLPTPNLPILSPDGRMNLVWYQFFNSLWQRTGGGSNSGNVQSISVNATNGIIASVDDATAQAIINLSLGGISPSSITTGGSILGFNGHFSSTLSVDGQLQFGAYTGSTISNTGYVTINDQTGTQRKLMVGT